MANAKRFAGKTALVTGAAQGIGKACANLLAAEGAQLIIADIQEKPLQAVAKELGAQSFVGDLSSYDTNAQLVEAANKALGKIDVAVFNVGGTILAKPLVEYTPPEIEAEINRSLWPTLWGCRAVIPHMITQGFGSIVNIGSVATRGINRVPYAAAKGGVQAITTALSLETADQGIRVNCVACGGTAVTDRTLPRAVETLADDERQHVEAVIAQTMKDTPMGRFGTVDEQAEAVAFLASDAASYITGQTLYVAGGGIG